jgi:hypothetical protein
VGIIGTLAGVAFAPTTTWQFQVSALPVFVNQALIHTRWYQDCFFDFTALSGVPGASKQYVAPIMIDYRDDVAGSLPVYPTLTLADPNLAANSATRGVISIVIPGMFFGPIGTNEKLRIIGVSFHVINTTPLQYMGGTCTVYRPVLELDDRIFNARGSSINNDSWQGNYAPGVGGEGVAENFGARVIQLPLGDVASARNFPTFQQWSAHEGSYSVCALDNDEFCNWTSGIHGEVPIGIAFAPPPPALPSFRNSWSRSDVIIGAVSVGSYSITLRNAGGAITSIIDAQSAYINSIETTCSRFTELPVQSTFMLNVIWMFEILPDLTDPNFTIAHQSAPYDPIALEYYKKISRAFPAGTLVRFNPLGEWFAKILGVLAKVAGPVGIALGAAGVPFAAQVGGGVQAASSAILSYMNKPGKAV